MKSLPYVGMPLHVASGLTLLALTVWQSLAALDFFGGEIRYEVTHSLLGFIVLYTVGIIEFFGFITLIFMWVLKWKTALIMWMKWLHLVTGYTLVLVSQVTTLLGVIAYDVYAPGKNSSLGTYNLVLFLGIWLAAESIYQICLRKANAQVKSDKFIRTT